MLGRIVEAYLRGDEDVRVEGDTVVASIEGFMEPVRIPLAAVERASNARGHGGFRTLALRSAEELDDAVGHLPGHVNGVGRALGNKVLEMEETAVTSLYTVRPQHCNSKSVSRAVRLALGTKFDYLMIELDTGSVWGHADAVD